MDIAGAGPVEAVAVLGGESRRPLVDPVVAPEPDIETDTEEQAGVPVDEQQDVEHNLERSEGIRIVGFSFCCVEELENAVESKDSIDSHDDRTGNLVVALARKQEI